MISRLVIHDQEHVYCRHKLQH